MMTKIGEFGLVMREGRVKPALYSTYCSIACADALRKKPLRLSLKKHRSKKEGMGLWRGQNNIGWVQLFRLLLGKIKNQVHMHFNAKPQGPRKCQSRRQSATISGSSFSPCAPSEQSERAL